MMTTTKQVHGVGRRAFTLIELIAVMVVLAVLAGVAIPKYFNYADKAKASSLQGTMGGVRTALANFYSNSTFTGTAVYPTVTQLQTNGLVMQETIPNNPYNNITRIKRIRVLLDARNRVVAQPTKYGWNYYYKNNANPPIAVFWANSTDKTTVLDANGNPIRANKL